MFAVDDNALPITREEQVTLEERAKLEMLRLHSLEVAERRDPEDPRIKFPVSNVGATVREPWVGCDWLPCSKPIYLDEELVVAWDGAYRPVGPAEQWGRSHGLLLVEEGNPNVHDQRGRV